MDSLAVEVRRIVTCPYLPSLKVIELNTSAKETLLELKLTAIDSLSMGSFAAMIDLCLPGLEATLVRSGL